MGLVRALSLMAGPSVGVVIQGVKGCGCKPHGLAPTSGSSPLPPNGGPGPPCFSPLFRLYAPGLCLGWLSKGSRGAAVNRMGSRPPVVRVHYHPIKIFGPRVSVVEWYLVSSIFLGGVSYFFWGFIFFFHLPCGSSPSPPFGVFLAWGPCV